MEAQVDSQALRLSLGLESFNANLLLFQDGKLKDLAELFREGNLKGF